MTVSTDVDWEAAEEVAGRLGLHSRKLVGGRDPDEVIHWALRMERETRQVN